MSVSVGTATGYLDLDISGFLDGLRTAQSESEKATKSMATKISDGFDGVGSTLTSAGTALTTSVTKPVLKLGVNVVKTSADFESAMSKVKAISGATGEDFDKLNDKAREMGAITKFSASESAEAFQYMAMAGWNVDNMLGGISGVMNLAAASGEDLGTVSDIVTDAMTAFGLSANETSKVLKDGIEVEVDNTTRFVDALAAASNSSNTNVAMLGESFKYVAPVAGALGYSVEDTAIALGLMANQGIKASQSGTSLRTLFTNMANPTTTMAEAMDKLGVSLENEDGSMKSLLEVMIDLRKGFGQGQMDADEFMQSMQEIQNAFDEGKMSEEEYVAAVEDLASAMYGIEGAEKAQIAAQLAGKTGMAGLLAIVNTAEKDFDNLTDSIYNASGTSQEMADVMIDNLNGQMTILSSMLQELELQLGEILVPILKNLVAWFQDLVAKLQQMSFEQKEQIIKWIAIAAAIGPIILMLGKLATAIGSIISVFSKVPGWISKIKSGFDALKGVISGVSAPMAATIAIIAILVAAFKHLWDTNEEFRTRIIEIWNGVKEKFEEFVQGVAEKLNALGFDFKDIVEALNIIWNGFCELLAPVFEAAFEIVSDILGAVLDVITGILDVFVGLFTRNWEQCWSGVKEIFKGVWDAIVGVFTGVVDALKSIAETIFSWFGMSWEDWANIGRNIIEGIKNGITGAASDLYEGVKGVLSGMVDKVKEFLGIASPSKKMGDEVGKWMPPGIAVGFESAMGKATKDMQESLDEGIDSLETDDVNVGIKTDMLSTVTMVAEYFESMEIRLANAVANMKNDLEYLIAAGTAMVVGESIEGVNYNDNFRPNISNRELNGSGVSENVASMSTGVSSNGKKSNILTRNDIVSAIKEAMPDGDCILRVSEIDFARATRKVLNGAALNSGQMGLKI